LDFHKVVMILSRLQMLMYYSYSMEANGVVSEDTR